MSDDSVDSFAALFAGPPSSRRKAREARIQKERRAQFTDKQRNRGGVRTTQINFRCSPAFRDLAHAMAKRRARLDRRRDGGGARNAGQGDGVQGGEEWRLRLQGCWRRLSPS